MQKLLVLLLSSLISLQLFSDPGSKRESANSNHMSFFISIIKGQNQVVDFVENHGADALKACCVTNSARYRLLVSDCCLKDSYPQDEKFKLSAYDVAIGVGNFEAAADIEMLLKPELVSEESDFFKKSDFFTMNASPKKRKR